MAVELEDAKVAYAGAGSTGPFDITFYFLANTHILATKLDTNGTATVLTLTTDYTLTGAGDEDGGQLTLIVALATGETLTIERNVPLTQETNWPIADPFPAASHERAADKLTMIVQQLDAKLDRTIRQPTTDTTALDELPIASERANTALTFDATGQIVMADISGSVLSFIPTTEVFDGDGSDTTFTMANSATSASALIVRIDGVVQTPITDYTVSSTTLTFTTAPATGTGNIVVQNFGIAREMDTVGVDNVSGLGASSGASKVGFLQSGIGAVATTAQADGRLTFYVEQFGATGDGVADDTAEVQAALTAMNVAGGGVVRGSHGKTYLTSFVGTKTINSTAHRYCLLIPDNVLFDLNGATLKLADSQNAAIALNATAGTTQNTDLGICNGVLDGNQANQTSPATGEMACVFLHDVVRPKVYNIRAKNVRNYAGRFLKCDKGYFNYLHCEDSDGDGWSFGIDSNSQHVTRSFIDNIYSEGCLGTFGSLQGNGAIFTVQYCSAGKITTKDCAGKLKIQDSSLDSTFGQLTFIGTANGSANCGVGVQGNGAGLTVSRITIGQINSYSSFAYGSQFLDCADIQVGSINSYGDATDGSTTAVLIDDNVDGIKIGSIHVEQSGASGVDNQGADVTIGSVTARNNGQVTAGQANFNCASTCDGLHIGALISEDDQGTHTANRGVNFVSGSKNITIDDYHSRGDYAVAGNHLVDGGATNLKIGRYRIDDADLHVPLSNSASAGNVGGGEDDMLSLSTAARSLWGDGKGYRVKGWGFLTNNANPKTIKLYADATAILTTAMSINSGAFWEAEAIFIRKASNSQMYVSRITEGTAIKDLERGDATVTDTAAIVFKFTATVTDAGGGINNNDIAMRGMIVEALG